MKRDICRFAIGMISIVQLVMGTGVAVGVAFGPNPDLAAIRVFAYVYLGLSALALLAMLIRHLRWESDA